MRKVAWRQGHRALQQLIDSPSQSFFVLAIAWCTGIALAPLMIWAPPCWFFLFALTGFGIGLLFPSRLLRFLVLAIFLFCAGWFWYGQSLLPASLATVADRAGETLSVEGRVDTQVDRRIDKQLVNLQDLRVGEDQVEGRLLVSFPLYPEVSFGDRLAFACTIQKPEPFGGFAYDRYLESQGVQAVCYDPQYVVVQSISHPGLRSSLFSLKDFLSDRMAKLWPAPYGAFLEGLIFGGSSALPGGLRDDFSSSGLAHILAASGFNVSLFTSVLLSWLLQTSLPRKRSLLLVGFFLFAYVIMAGATAAVVRAALMASLLLWGAWVGRRAFLPNIVMGALALMLFWNPLWLWADVGFQLSFVAIIALLVLAPRWKEYFVFIPDRFGIRTAFVSSLAATFLTAPILLWHFGSLSLIAPIANLFVLPFIPFLIACALAALVVSIFYLPFGIIFALPSWGLSKIVLHVIVWFGSLPVLALPLGFARTSAVLLGGFWIFLMIHFCRRKKI